MNITRRIADMRELDVEVIEDCNPASVRALACEIGKVTERSYKTMVRSKTSIVVVRIK